MQRVRLVSAILLVFILQLCCSCSCLGSSTEKLKADGKVLELDESNFDSSISSFDYVLVDFYAPWCGHCKRLAPQLDVAAPLLAELKEPIMIAKVNADKYTRLAKKYEIDAYPTLKLFMHGVPVEYRGPRNPDLLVRYLKKFVAPDVAILDSDAAISDFVESAGTFFPIYLGFGLNESMVFNLAVKYKKKAWFSVAKDFSEDVMVLYDFDKVPALVSLLPNYNNEQSIFYGPFEEEFLEDFIKQSLLPVVMPINYDTLKLLKDDERKIALTIVDDEDEEKTKILIKLLKAAASANRDLVFGYVGVKQWQEFADTFGANKKTPLPRMVIWEGKEEYFSVIGSETVTEEDDHGTQISKFLEGYREGRIVQNRVSGPSFLSYINSQIGINTVFLIVLIVAVIMVVRNIMQGAGADDEPLRVGTREQVENASSSVFEAKSKEYSTGDKED